MSRGVLMEPSAGLDLFNLERAAVTEEKLESPDHVPSSVSTTLAEGEDPSELAHATLQKLVQSNAETTKAASAEEDNWLEQTAQKLRTALLGYNLQAKIVGTRLTPNAALIRFLGSDRLRVEDVEARQSALLTTHGLRMISISPLPGEIVVGVARLQRQIVSLWDVCPFTLRKCRKHRPKPHVLRASVRPRPADRRSPRSRPATSGHTVAARAVAHANCEDVCGTCSAWYYKITIIGLLITH
jgi:hypothetical protein